MHAHICSTTPTGLAARRFRCPSRSSNKTGAPRWATTPPDSGERRSTCT